MHPVEPLPPPIQPKKILVRGVNWLGDAVMTTPALQRLREQLPECRITLLTPKHLAELWSNHPSIDAHLVFEPHANPWSVARRIHEETFDAALVFPNSPRSALEVWLAGIPQRIGYARAWRNWFLTRTVSSQGRVGEKRKRPVREIRRLIADPNHATAEDERPPSSGHQVYEYLRLVAALGASPLPVAPKLEVATAELQAVRSSLLENLPAAREAEPPAAPVWLGLNPSAAYGPAKCWPAERFAAVARAVSQQIKNCYWLVFGSQSDRQLCEQVTQMCGSKVANLAGKTSLRELMALLKLCRVVLTNDSGPMHVAAALGTPVVVPFGSTSPALTGPGLPGDPRHRLLQANAPCSPCFRRTCPIDFRCMTGITVEAVVSAVLDALRAQSAQEA